MKQTFVKRFWNTGRWFICLFFVMLAFHIINGYTSKTASEAPDYSGDFFNSVDNLRKNYASEKVPFKSDPGEAPVLNSSQKYEKTATLKSKTSQFERDAESIKSMTKQFLGVIQYEQNMGNKGNRHLHLLIGVNPEKFDDFYAQVQHIGKISSMEITKIDKTNEYRQLNAKKTSLEKTLISLNDLKSKGGVISDYVSLHDKILEIESRMQELGVELGNFDSENEFCTVRFSLHEGQAKKEISFMKRLKISLEWTIQWYAILMFSLLALMISVLVLLLIVDKLGMMRLIHNKLN